MYRYIVNQNWFEAFVMANILLIGLATGLDLENGGRSDSINAFVEVASLLTFIVFTSECTLKLISEAYTPKDYFLDPENGERWSCAGVGFVSPPFALSQLLHRGLHPFSSTCECLPRCFQYIRLRHCRRWVCLHRQHQRRGGRGPAHATPHSAADFHQGGTAAPSHHEWSRARPQVGDLYRHAALPRHLHVRLTFFLRGEILTLKRFVGLGTHST